MAEMLVYNTTHWMDKVTTERAQELRANDPQWDRRYAGRYQSGDVVEVRPDGYWTGPKAPGYNREVFRLVLAPGVKVDQVKHLMEGRKGYRRGFRVAAAGTVRNIRELGIAEKP